MQNKNNLHRLQFTDEEKGAPRLKEHTRTQETVPGASTPGADMGVKRPRRPMRPDAEKTAERPAPQDRASQSRRQTGQEPAKAAKHPAAQEQPKAAQRSALILLFINVLDMDVQGSAAALLSARALGTLSAAAFLILPRDLPIRLSLRDILSCQQDILSSILEVALPFGLEQMLLYGGNIVITVLLVPLGTAAVTVNAVATSLFGMVTAAAYAAGTLAMTVVGRCAGAGQYRSAFTYGYKITALAFFLLAMGCLLFYPMFPFLLDRLYHVVPPLRTEALHLLKSILIPALLFWSMSSTLPNVLRAAHDTVFPSVLGTLTMWFVRIGLGWVLAFPAGMGLSGLWISMWAEWAVRSLFLGMRYFGSHWLEKVSS